jgi:hypothetical protein
MPEHQVGRQRLDFAMQVKDDADHGFHQLAMITCRSRLQWLDGEPFGSLAAYSELANRSATWRGRSSARFFSWCAPIR